MAITHFDQEEQREIREIVGGTSIEDMPEVQSFTDSDLVPFIKVTGDNANPVKSAAVIKATSIGGGGSGGGDVNGVKGDAEENYRKGNVNITKANIGLGNVENKSASTLSSEIMTSENVKSVLGCQQGGTKYLKEDGSWDTPAGGGGGTGTVTGAKVGSGSTIEPDANGIINLPNYETDAQKNVKPDWNAVSGSAAEILNKPTIPAGVEPSSSTPLEATDNGAAGTDTRFARGDHRHPHDSTKVDKVQGKGLSTNDYDDTEKGKVAAAYSKPSNGIPKNDLASDVQASLGKADTAVQLENGEIPSRYLPSYVDDVINGYYKTADGKFYEEDTYTTEITPEGGKIYVDLSTDKTYRWSGSAYVQIKGDLVIGTTTGTAADGKVVNDHITDTTKHITAAERTTWNGKQNALTFNTTPSSANKVATMNDIPSSLPANGGNAATVNGHSVEKDVPSDAVFTDHTYSVMGASGSTHAPGLVPDTPTTAGTSKFLREDGQWAEPQGGGGGAVSGVKGDAESSYRTGNVNITPANILTKTSTNDGLGHIYDAPDSVISTAAFFTQTNTVYHIRYNHTLSTTTEVEVPAGCTISFEGGSFTNGTLKGVFAINDPKYKIFNNLEFKIDGTILMVDFIRPEWFGAKGDFDQSTGTGTDDSAAINASFHAAMTTGVKKVKFMGAYFVGAGVTIDSGGIILEGTYGEPFNSYVRPDKAGERTNYYRSALIGALEDGGFVLKIASTAAAQITIRNINFTGINYPKEASGITFQSEHGGPLWPFIVEYCNFSGFHKAIEFKSTNSYNVYDVDIQRCGFLMNDFIVWFDDEIPKTGLKDMLGNYDRNLTYGLRFCDNCCISNTRHLYINTVMGDVKIQRNDFEVHRANYGGGIAPTGKFESCLSIIGVASNVHVDFSDNYYEADIDLYPLALEVFKRYTGNLEEEPDAQTHGAKVSIYNNHYWYYYTQSNDNYAIQVNGHISDIMTPQNYLIIERCDNPIHVNGSVTLCIPDKIPDITIAYNVGTVQILSNNLDFPVVESNNNEIYNYEQTAQYNSNGVKALNGELYYTRANGVPLFKTNISSTEASVYTVFSAKYIDQVRSVFGETICGFTKDSSTYKYYKSYGMYVSGYCYTTVIRRFTDFPIGVSFYLAGLTQRDDFFFNIMTFKIIKDDGYKKVGSFGIRKTGNNQLHSSLLPYINGQKKGDMFLLTSDTIGESDPTFKPIWWTGSKWVDATGEEITQ